MSNFTFDFISNNTNTTWNYTFPSTSGVAVNVTVWFNVSLTTNNATNITTKTVNLVKI